MAKELTPAEKALEYERLIEKQDLENKSYIKLLLAREGETSAADLRRAFDKLNLPQLNAIKSAVDAAQESKAALAANENKVRNGIAELASQYGMSVDELKQMLVEDSNKRDEGYMYRFQNPETLVNEYWKGRGRKPAVLESLLNRAVGSQKKSESDSDYQKRLDIELQKYII